jgi:hypothetical protein
MGVTIETGIATKVGGGSFDEPVDISAPSVTSSSVILLNTEGGESVSLLKRTPGVGFSVEEGTENTKVHINWAVIN